MKKRFSHSPARAICGTVTAPVPYTIAFGGVATGSMNAQLAASAAGTASINGSTPIAVASDPTTGRNAAVVAVLLVSSVRNTTTVVTTRVTGRSGHPPTQDNDAPIHSASPVA